MKLSPAEVENIQTAAVLHDVGKAEVVELIRKPAALAPEEKARVDKHIRLGAELLRTAGPVLRDAVPLVLEHRRFYQDSGDAIPQGARIIAVADAYDAIVSDRPYRQARPHKEAVQILKEAAGHQFDPKVVEILESSAEKILALYRGK